MSCSDTSTFAVPLVLNAVYLLLRLVQVHDLIVTTCLGKLSWSLLCVFHDFPIWSYPLSVFRFTLRVCGHWLHLAATINSWELLQYIRRSVHDSGFLYTSLFRSGGDIFCFAYVQTIVSKPVSVSTRGHFFILHNPSFIWNIEDFQGQTQHVKLLDKINNYLLVNWVGGLYGKVFKNMFTHCD